MKINNREFSSEEIKPLIQFIELLIEWDQQINPNKQHYSEHHGTLPLPYLKKSSCTPRILLHPAPNSPYFGISLYGHIKLSKTKKNQIIYKIT